MDSHTALGAAYPSSLLCLRSSFLPGLGLPGGVTDMDVDDMVVETLSSRREDALDLNDGGVVAPSLTREEGALCMCCMLLAVLSSQSDMVLFTTFLLPLEAARAVAESSLRVREVVREGATREAASACLRWVRCTSLVPVARPNHLAPRCWRT